MIFPALESAKACLRIAAFSLGYIEIKEGLLDDPRYLYLFSVEEVNRRVLEGIPFRDAYREIGAAIAAGEFNPDRRVVHTHEGSIGNLCNAEIKAKWDRIFGTFGFDKIEHCLRELAEG
jgi:argininosuccinate lyase